MTSPDGPLPLVSLLDKASARCGLDDWGDPSFFATLELLLESCQETAALTPTGYAVLNKVVLRHLTNRLHVQACWTHRGQAGSSIQAPIVITGLPRTGTTLLQNLLAADPANRALRLWEALQPVPPNAVQGTSKEALTAKADTWLAGLYALAPTFRAIHALTAEGPEECDALFQNSFASQHFDDMFRADTYSAWLNSATLTNEYAFYARQLRLLTDPTDEHRRWVLKSPSHLGYLDTLRGTFPGVVIVHCHRDPYEAISSYASLVFAVRSSYTDGLSPHEAGEHALNRAGTSLDRALAVRSNLDDGGFVDVGYSELVADPMRTVRRLYDRLGRHLDDPAYAAMSEYLADNPQHKHGHNAHTLQQFGLTRAQVSDRLGAYRERFPAETA